MSMSTDTYIKSHVSCILGSPEKLEKLPQSCQSPKKPFQTFECSKMIRMICALGSKPKRPIFFRVVEDGHQPHIRGLYTSYKDSLLKVG